MPSSFSELVLRAVAISLTRRYLARSSIFFSRNDSGLLRLRATLGIAILTEMGYPIRMTGITIKLPETTLRRLRQEARASGRSVAALIRERLEVAPNRDSRSVYELTADLAGCVAGSGQSATNARRKFVRS